MLQSIFISNLKVVAVHVTKNLFQTEKRSTSQSSYIKMAISLYSMLLSLLILIKK